MITTRLSKVLLLFASLALAVFGFRAYTVWAVASCVATGGTITTSGAYTIHTFTSSGTFTVTSGTCNAEVLVVAGGGGGAAMTGGGGGAGGLLYDAAHALTPQAYTVTVGAGGAGQVGTANPGYGSDGQNSVFDGMTAIGGGGGATNSGIAGRPGGSGGGAGHNNTTGGTGTAGQGNNGRGANTTSPNYGAGGGGGAGGMGTVPTNTAAGTGGDGLAYSISGSSVYYAGGGGGGTYMGGTLGLGGLGGGGNAPAGNATPNTGGGGGGQKDNLANGGNGGSGIVIVRYLTSASNAVMASTNYQINFDTIDSGGGRSTSTSYAMESAVGEQATGDSTSTNYRMRAGYEQLWSSFISISSPSDVALSSINGLTGGSSNGSVGWNVTTDSPSGYTLYIKASTSPALRSAGGASFADYAPAGAAPDFSFSITTSQSAFGFSPEGPDIVGTFKDNGSACNTGSSDTANACWDGFSTTQKTIAVAPTYNQPLGATTTVKLRAQIGTAKIQDSGTYSAIITATAVSI